MKKMICFLVALVMMATPLFACAQNEDGVAVSGDDNAGARSETPGAADNEDSEQPAYIIDDGLSGLDFGGRTFNILAYGHPICQWEFLAEELTGGVINDAVYHRNRAVEERLNVILNIDFSDEASTSVGDAANRNVNAGDHVYDVYFGHIMRMGQTVLNNVFMDVYALDHIDFSKPWWPDMAVRNLSVANRAFLMVGEVNFSFLLAAYGVFFNSEMAADGGVPPSELYRMVLDGEWTIDRKIELARDFTRDLTGGGGALTANDQFGLTTTTGFASAAYMWGFGQMLANIGADGVPYLNLPNTLMNEIVDRIYELYFHTFGTNAVAFNDPGWTVADPLRNGNTFMLNHYLYTALRLRDLEVDFGILPYPKLNEAQTQYFSVADGFHTALAVPITTAPEDFGFVGAVLESLNAETYRTVVPAYYDIALQLQGARDAESQLVMDMIRDGRLVDFGGVYDGWTGFAFAISELMQQRSSNFASYYERRERAARRHFERVLETFERLDG